MKVRQGSVTISIIPHTVTAKGREYQYHRVCYHQDGKLHRITKKNEKEALQLANDKALELAKGRTAANQVSNEDAAAIARIKQILAEKGITKPPELAIAEYCEQITARRTLEARPATLFSLLVTDFLAVKATDGTRYRYRKELKERLTALQTQFQCPLETLDAASITAALDDLQRAHAWTNRTRNHYRAALSNLANWARDTLKIRRDWKEIEFVKKLKERDGQIIIWTPEEAAQLFATAEKEMPDLIPTLVLAFFIGHRHSEAIGSNEDDVAPIDWRDLNLETGEGYLEEGKVRSAGNRITFIPPNARAWLKQHRKASGPVCRYQNLSNQYRKLAKLAKTEWRQNAARRSYISYRLSLTKNLPMVSEECGTSISTLQKRYRKPRPLTEAQKYFNIMPVIKRRDGKISTPRFTGKGNRHGQARAIAKSQNKAKTVKPGRVEKMPKQHRTP